MIGRQLYQAGLIQFGVFKRHGEIFPIDLPLTMLASYPDLLGEIADQAAAQLTNHPVSRLLAVADALPLGVALSLRLKVPLVYSRGTGTSPVDDLVGAFDIGHPALLVTNSFGADESIEVLIAGARRVGLEVNTIVTIVGTQQTRLNGVEVIALVQLRDVLDEFAAMGELPVGHADLVRDWLNQN